MSVTEIRIKLVRFLGYLLSTESAAFETSELSRQTASVPYPQELIEAFGLEQGTALVLSKRGVEQYKECLWLINRERVEGHLEYAQRWEVKHLLDNLIVSVWIARENTHYTESSSIVQDFIATHFREPEEWQVAWEINHLFIDDDSVLRVAGVEYMMLSEQHIADFGSVGEVNRSIGKTFGFVQVTAGSYERALQRARSTLTDSLDVLRVLLYRGMSLGGESLRQELGTVKMVRSIKNDDLRLWAWFPEDYILSPIVKAVDIFEPNPAQVNAKSMAKLAEELSRSFDEPRPSKISNRLARSILLLGSSHYRRRYDDSVLDLTVSLETLLAKKDDKRKAEAIAARFWLLQLAFNRSIGPSTHPLDLYDLYELRNDIIHGTGRSMSSRIDVQRLRSAANDTIDLVREALELNPTIRSTNRLFQRLQTVELLEIALSHLDLLSANRQGTASEKVSSLLQEWRNDTSPQNLD